MSKAFEYTIGPYKIRVNIWLLIVFLLMQTLLNELGFWQLERAKEKQYRIQQLAKGEQSVVSDLSLISEKILNNFKRLK